MKCLGCSKSQISNDAIFCPECGTVFSSFPVLKPGTCLKGGINSSNAYKIDYAIGKGGFGVTYKAWDNMNNRRVAIKELLPSEYAARPYGERNINILGGNTSSFERIRLSFIRESNCLSSLRSNKHIAGYYDYFEENNTSYIVMEYIDGLSLEQKIRNAPENRFSQEYIFKIGSQLVNALAYAHKNGVYHCDLCPRNIMLKEDDFIVLIDFGAARYEYRLNSHSAINDCYSPIELLARRDDIRNNAGSDIFMLGTIIYEVLTGERPPSTIERTEKINREFTAQNIDEPFKSLVEKALKYNIEDRPDNIQEWWNTIQTYFTHKKCVNTKCKRFGKIISIREHIYCTCCGHPLSG